MQNTPWTSLLLLFSLEICNFYPKKNPSFLLVMKNLSLAIGNCLPNCSEDRVWSTVICHWYTLNSLFVSVTQLAS